jgi:uncharacterized membrane protein YhdT
MTRETEKPFVEDPRFRQCNKEALMGLGLGILNMIWWFAWGYGLGSRPPEEYTYVLGFPLWFFMGSIVGAALFTAAAIIMVRKYFVDMPLDSINQDEADKLKELMR